MVVRRAGTGENEAETIRVELRDEHLDEATLRAYAAKKLPPAERLLAIRHLDRCEACARALEGDPLVGTMLGEYRVLAPLSRGGMSAIYRGEQPTIGKQVAIKVLLPHVLGDPEQLRRLLGEARAVNAIHHPNIIDIFSFGSLPDGGQYFVMELLEGQSAMAWVEEKGRFNAGEVLTVLEQTMAALAAAHARNVLHRDLKPSNLFITTLADQSWHVTVLDFGLAKQLGGTNATNPDLVVGTPGYMAPEQIRGEPLTAACDLYAMGCVAWALLTAEEAFEFETAQDLMYKHLEESHPPLSEAAPDCPPELAGLVHRLLEKDPKKRPASAREVLSELARLRVDLRGVETMKLPVLKGSSATRPSGRGAVSAATKPDRPKVGQTTKPDRPSVAQATEQELAKVELVPREEKGRPPWLLIGGVLFGIVLLGLLIRFL